MPAREPHSALIRVTHWMNALSFAAPVVSGVAILLAHPRLYWHPQTRLAYGISAASCPPAPVAVLF